MFMSKSSNIEEILKTVQEQNILLQKQNRILLSLMEHNIEMFANELKPDIRESLSSLLRKDLAALKQDIQDL